MKILTYKYQGSEGVGIICDGGINILPVGALGIDAPDMTSLIRNCSLSELLKRFDEYTNSAAGTRGANEGSEAAETAPETEKVPIYDADVLAPIPEPAQDIICLGINYMEHAVESARFKKEAFGGDRPFPVYFSKRVNRAVGPGETIDGHFDITEQVDYEAELAVVIGRDAKDVKAEDSRDYIFGYTILNDVSSRDIQTRHKQWYFGKSLDDFTPIGPWIVTADEFAYPPKLDIKSVVNGELRQNSNTGLMIFDIPYVIENLSAGMTLKAGTIIATGTPSGVGMGMQPPCFLKPGDTVECIIEGIGTLKNTVK